MRVDPTSAPAALTAIPAAQRTGDASRSVFATALLAATDTPATTGTGAAETAATTTGTRSADTATSSGTAATGGGTGTGGTTAAGTTTPVEDKPYERSLSGPRMGMYINRSGNGRDGEAFVLVEKPGRDVHVYGTGKDRETVVMWHADAATPPAGEVSVKVAGEDYDRITAGPRKGMFVNRSGNARDGLVFSRVEHAHREDHVYGLGADREIIRAWDAGHGPHAAATGNDAATSGAEATSGEAATPDAATPDAAAPDAAAPDAAPKSAGSTSPADATATGDHAARASAAKTTTAATGGVSARSTA